MRAVQSSQKACIKDWGEENILPKVNSCSTRAWIMTASLEATSKTNVIVPLKNNSFLICVIIAKAHAAAVYHVSLMTY